MKINMGIGDKFATTIMWFSTFLAGYILGFVQGWELALVILSVAPLIVLSVALLSKVPNYNIFIYPL